VKIPGELFAKARSNDSRQLGPLPFPARRFRVLIRRHHTPFRVRPIVQPRPVSPAALSAPPYRRVPGFRTHCPKPRDAEADTEGIKKKFLVSRFKFLVQNSRSLLLIAGYYSPDAPFYLWKNDAGGAEIFTGGLSNHQFAFISGKDFQRVFTFDLHK
jgi:hypothetical protein